MAVLPEPEQSRPLRLPRVRSLVEPLSRVEAGFYRSAGFYVRVSLLGVLALGLFGVLALRLWSLQLLQGPKYAHVARSQIFRFVDLPTARAPIVDERGRLLVGTEGRVALAFDAGSLGRLDDHGRWHADRRGIALLGRVARLTGVRRATLVKRVRAHALRAPYSPAVLIPRLRQPLALYFDEHAREFPGVHVAVLAQRSYPQRALGSEFLGLLGEINPSELARAAYRGYRAGQVIGQSGVEASYDRLLNGGFDRARVAVDSLGREVGPLSVVERSQPNRVLELTIDARLQQAAERAIRNGIAYAHLAGHPDADAGAAVVMNPRNGAVYALASYPSFSQVDAVRDPEYLARLLHSRDPRVPLLDRATQGLYPTGSTFKPVVAEAALQSGLITPSTIIPCTGSLRVGNHVFHNVEPSIYALMNLRQALSISCDTWFYRLGTRFYWLQQRGNPAMQRWAHRLGLGRPTGFDVPGEAVGVVPTPAWLKRTFSQRWQRIWYEGYSVNLAIGQGYLAVTPLQLAVAYSALANGGTVVQPHVGRALLDSSGHLVRALRFRRAHLRLKDLWAIRQGLYDAAHVGTSAAIFARFPIPVAGKTGTAETPYGSDHSWYASWAPAWRPRVVVVVLIEHGGFGVEAAAPAARDIYSAFFRLRR